MSHRLPLNLHNQYRTHRVGKPLKTKIANEQRCEAAACLQMGFLFRSMKLLKYLGSSPANVYPGRQEYWEVQALGTLLLTRRSKNEFQVPSFSWLSPTIAGIWEQIRNGKSVSLSLLSIPPPFL